ncbi:MAG: hypothetical protein A2Z34_02880 [Planctomycetes bacterium RBG_16_59_8]|nr:MAG: hypothetical protein A2Z34_02880 [Planctomycetes bacterium RBG_16_59_8]
MMSRFARVCGIVLPMLAVLTMAAQDPAPEPAGKYRLACGGKVGDRFTVKTSVLLDIDIALADITKKKSPSSSRFVRSEEFEVEILEAEAAALKVHCLRSTVEADLSTEVKTSLDGQTFVLRKGENGFRPEGEIPNVNKKDLGFVENLGFFRQFLPTDEASPKDQWKVKPTGLLAVLCGGVKGDAQDELTCSFTGVEGGIAEIALAYNSKSNHGEKSTSETKLNGSFRFDIARGMPVSFNLAGSVNTAGTLLRKEEGTGKVDEVGSLVIDSKKLEFSVEFAPVAEEGK